MTTRTDVSLGHVRKQDWTWYLKRKQPIFRPAKAPFLASSWIVTSNATDRAPGWPPASRPCTSMFSHRCKSQPGTRQIPAIYGAFETQISCLWPSPLPFRPVLRRGGGVRMDTAVDPERQPRVHGSSPVGPPRAQSPLLL